MVITTTAKRITDADYDLEVLIKRMNSIFGNPKCQRNKISTGNFNTFETTKIKFIYHEKNYLSSVFNSSTFCRSANHSNIQLYRHIANFYYSCLRNFRYD